MENAKNTIETIVRDYCSVFASEYEAFRSANRAKVAASKDDYGEVRGSDMVVRKLYEIPETLFGMLNARMSREEYEWLRTADGSKWFSKRFPQFRSSEKL